MLGLSHAVKVVVVCRLQNQTDPIVELLPQQLIELHLESALFCQQELGLELVTQEHNLRQLLEELQIQHLYNHALLFFTHGDAFAFFLAQFSHLQFLLVQ